MNFEHVNKIADYVRSKVMPYLKNTIQITDFGYYLTKMSETPSCRWMRKDIRVFPVNYCVEPIRFLQKYEKRCVAFVGTPSPQEGVMNIVYQLSPTFHVLARFYHWIENDEVLAYLMLTCAYKEYNDFLEFYDDNISLRMVGNSEEKPLGFGGIMKSRSMSVNNLVRQTMGQPVEDNSIGDVKDKNKA